MSQVRAKKSFGQHFLKNKEIAYNIAAGNNPTICSNVLEIGPGMGILTEQLLTFPTHLKVIEVDRDSIAYLKENNVLNHSDIIEGDFLKLDLLSVFNNEQFSIAGNFPYNISSQIVFKIIDNRTLIPQMTGMFQREVARRLASKHGSKEYGIISVLCQAYYDIEYLFTVHENEFNPPPKVKSGVITLTRKENLTLPCSEKFLITVVKAAFNQRRKTLNNSLKKLLQGEKLNEKFGMLRPEQIDVEGFFELTNHVEELVKGGNNAV